VFLKMMLTRYGGNGYAFVRATSCRGSPPRDGRGVAPGADDDNPRRVFDATA
jgi:hypothetical protein